MLMLFSPDFKVQQTQREHMAVMRFLAAFPSEYDLAKTRILSSSVISSLQNTFTRILHTEISSSFSSPAHPFAQMSNAFVSWNIGESGKQ